MTAIQITDVMVHKPPLDHLHGAHIELPAPGESSDIYVFEVSGWALGRSARVMNVEAVQEQRQVAEAPVTGARPDIAAASSEAENAALQPFAYDTRAATYWISVLQELTQPASFLSPFDPPNLADRRWWLGKPAVRLEPLQDARIREWLGFRGISSLAAFCQEQIESFYINAAGAGGPVRYFVEKCLPWQVVPD